MNPPPQQRRFLELTIVGSGKSLYIPSDAVLTYEQVPEGKNEHFPQASTFLRYDYGEGLSFALVDQPMEEVKELVSTNGFLELHLVDEAEIYVKDVLIQAIQEVEDDGVSATRLSVTLGGEIGSLFVKDSFADIKTQRGG